MEITFRSARTARTAARMCRIKNTAHMETRVMPPPDEVTLPMTQHIGAPCTPVVKKATTCTSARRSRTVTPTFRRRFTPPYPARSKEIAKVMMPGGQMADAVVITSDRLMERDPRCAAAGDPHEAAARAGPRGTPGCGPRRRGIPGA